jgi:hypothetical protein
VTCKSGSAPCCFAACSGGEGLELAAPLFSDKTLTALLGAQMQQYAAEAQQEVCMLADNCFFLLFPVVCI